MVTREELYFQLLDEKDVRAAERVFRKVVHPGLDSMQLVDRNRLSISSAPGYGLRQKSFVISPRGVPTRISNHVYSGYHSHYTRYDGVTGTESPEFNISQPSTGMISSRLQAYSAMPSKKRAISSKSAFRAMHMTKSATSDRYQGSISNNKRFLKSAKSDQCHKSRSDQEERLDKEWTNMSNCRALKRSSEIVSHRVDRMYYMNGNSLKLQPRYQVDEDELTQLREMSKSRQSARQQRSPRMSQPAVNRSNKVLKSSTENGNPQAESEKVVKARSDTGVANDNRFRVRRDSDSNSGSGGVAGGKSKIAKGRKSPLQGWGNGGGGDRDTGEPLSIQGDLIRKETFHDENNFDNVENDEEKMMANRADGRQSSEDVNKNDEQNDDVDKDKSEDAPQLEGGSSHTDNDNLTNDEVKNEEEEVLQEEKKEEENCQTDGEQQEEEAVPEAEEVQQEAEDVQH